MFEELRKLYSTGATFDVAFRKERLRLLAACLEAERGALESALKADLGKSAEEAWLTEIGFRQRLRYCPTGQYAQFGARLLPKRAIRRASVLHARAILGLRIACLCIFRSYIHDK